MTRSTTDRKREGVLVPVITLGLGGRTFRYTAEEPGTSLRVGPLHPRFAVGGDAPADVEVRCRIGSAEPSAAAVQFDAGVWDVRPGAWGGDEVCFYTGTPDGARLPMTRLELDETLRSARLFYTPPPGGSEAIPVGYRLDEFLAARVLGRSGAFVLHASSLLDAGGVLAFMGHSGAGKSTIAALAESLGAEVLSDDRTVITLDDAGRAVAWGTPWHGTHARGSPRSAPLRGLFLLRQDIRDSVVPLGAARAFIEMHVRVIQPTVDRDEVRRAVAAVERAASAVRAAELRFRPTTAAYALARDFAGL